MCDNCNQADTITAYIQRMGNIRMLKTIGAIDDKEYRFLENKGINELREEYGLPIRTLKVEEFVK